MPDSYIIEVSSEAAGIVVREAGGYVTEPDGGHNPIGTGDILAANDHLHMPLGRLLRKALG